MECATGWWVEDEHRSVGPAGGAGDILRRSCLLAANAARELAEWHEVHPGDARRPALVRGYRRGIGGPGTGLSTAAPRPDLAHTVCSSGAGASHAGRARLSRPASRVPERRLQRRSGVARRRHRLGPVRALPLLAP